MKTRSGRGSTQWGVRWKTCRAATSGAMAGMTWAALAPLPTTATRLPRRSTPWSQSLVWKASPAKLSLPGKGGTTGVLSGPEALMTNCAR